MRLVLAMTNAAVAWFLLSMCRSSEIGPTLQILDLSVGALNAFAAVANVVLYAKGR